MIKRELVGLDSSALCPITPGHFLTQATSIAFQLMAQAAQSDGINIAIASSYRSYERQSLIWNRKFRGESVVLNSAGEPIPDWLFLSEQERIFAILRWSALPGASRHHWGTDLDVYAPDLLPEGQKLQLTPAEYDEEHGYFGALTTWLNNHMNTFGFFRPYATDQGGVAPEPWHLSYHSEAVRLQQQLTLEMLQEVIAENPLEGQHWILQLLPQIREQFIININGENSL